MATTLTKLAIDAAIAGVKKGQRVELIDDRERGLRIRCGERGGKWSLQSRTKLGQLIRVPIGSWPGMGIADARKAAQDVKRDMERGINPNAEKRDAARKAEIAAKTRRSLSDVLDEYEREKLAKLRRGAATRRALDGKKGLLRDMLRREPASITKADIADAVKRHAKTSPIAANRALAYASAFFNWCVEEDIVPSNPAGTVKKPGKENQRDRYHSLDELREIWEAAGTLGYPFGPLYQTLIALPMRREEIAALPVAELDLGPDDDPTQGVWTLPGDRTKTDKPLRVPLSPLARMLIKAALADEDRPADSPFVFTTTGETSISGFAKGKRRLDRAISEARVKAAREAAVAAGMQYENAPEDMPHFTIHDLRTTFSTLASQKLKVPIDVADRCLNHVASATTSKIKRIYNQDDMFDERRAALNAWATMIQTEVLGQGDGNVIPLRQANAA